MAAIAGVVQWSETIPVSNRVGINLLLLDEVPDDVHVIPTASRVQRTRFSFGNRRCIRTISGKRRVSLKQNLHEAQPSTSACSTYEGEPCFMIQSVSRAQTSSNFFTIVFDTLHQLQLLSQSVLRLSKLFIIADTGKGPFLHRIAWNACGYAQICACSALKLGGNLAGSA